MDYVLTGFDQKPGHFFSQNAMKRRKAMFLPVLSAPAGGGGKRAALHGLYGIHRPVSAPGQAARRSRSFLNFPSAADCVQNFFPFRGGRSGSIRGKGDASVLCRRFFRPLCTFFGEKFLAAADILFQPSHPVQAILVSAPGERPRAPPCTLLLPGFPAGKGLLSSPFT